MDILDACVRGVRAGDTALDVGAFRGDIAWGLADAVGPTGRVYAFEPHPMVFAVLSARAGALPTGQLLPYCKAMSDRVGHAPFFFDGGNLSSQASTLMPGLANAARLGPRMCRCLVESDTVDAFCERGTIRPAFIKIDVEGAEGLVLAGAARTIASARPTIIFESGFGGNSRLPQARELELLGYDLFLVDVYHHHDQHTQPGDPVHSPHVFPIRHEQFGSFDQVLGVNLLAVHADRRADLPIIEHIGPGSAVDFLRAAFARYEAASVRQTG